MSGMKRGAAGLIAGLVLVGFVGAGTSRAGILADQPETLTFECTGTPETWTVPEGVTTATFEVAGARGGNQFSAPGPDNAGSGADGAIATATVAVTAGETIQVNVGCAGEAGTDSAGGAGGYGGTGDANGGDAPDGDGSGAGGGGGSSDVRQGGTALANRIVVGGGGGGGANGGNDAGSGGAGGSPDGGDGEDCLDPVDPLPQGGDGGTTSGGGAGGAGGGSGPGADGVTATSAAGGAGGAGGGSNTSGGGGGGGYFGGGGGGGGTQGDCSGGGGGGGASFGPAGTSYAANTASTDGFVTITFGVTPPTPPTPEAIVIEPTFTG